MNIKNVIYIVVACVFISACNKAPEAPAASDLDTRAVVGAPSGATVATVNGEILTEPMLDVFAKGRGMDPADPAARQRALDTLIENVLLAQDALGRGLAQRPEVQAEVALVRLQQLAGRDMSDLRAGITITEEATRAYYDAEAARTGGIEVNLKHILFADEASARAASDRAQAPGADFDALIAEYGTGTAKQARDLGWANLTQLPSELAEATRKLTDGQIATAPVQTAFGWHVFKREASRPFVPPSYDDVREGARKQLLEQAMADKVKALREKAKIDIAVATPPPAGG
jgi:peptidyl-prolyl cis-trans isomerase C